MSPLRECEKYNNRALSHRLNMKNYKTERFKTALNLYRENRFSELFEYCEKATQEEINNLELWKLFGVSAGTTGNSSIALKCLETVWTIEPNNMNLANYLRAMFHNDMAEEAIDKLYELEAEIDEDMIQHLKMILIEAADQYDLKQLLESLPKSLFEKLKNIM